MSLWSIHNKSSVHGAICIHRLHRKKKVREFPVPSRDVTTKLSLGGNNDVITELFLPRGSLVSDIPAGDGRLVNLFLRCMTLHPIPLNFLTYEEYFLFFFISADHIALSQTKETISYWSVKDIFQWAKLDKVRKFQTWTNELTEIFRSS